MNFRDGSRALAANGQEHKIEKAVNQQAAKEKPRHGEAAVLGRTPFVVTHDCPI